MPTRSTKDLIGMHGYCPGCQCSVLCSNMDVTGRHIACGSRCTARLVDLLPVFGHDHWLWWSEVDRYLAMLPDAAGPRIVVVAYDHERVRAVWRLGNLLNSRSLFRSEWVPVPADKAMRRAVIEHLDEGMKVSCMCPSSPIYGCCDACWEKEAAASPCTAPGCRQPRYHAGDHGPLHNLAMLSRWSMIDEPEDPCALRPISEGGVVYTTGKENAGVKPL